MTKLPYCARFKFKLPNSPLLPKCGSQMGEVLSRDWELRSQAARRASPLEVHTPWLLTLIEEQPDLTLDEVVSAMRKHGIAGSRTAGARDCSTAQTQRHLH